ncbi:MAG TPA: MlaD family protein [Pseudonocardia sp.]|jgi:virulence factor Mce-like protein
MSWTRQVATLAALGLLLAIGLGYVLVGIVQFDPFAKPIRATVNLANLGGLLDRSQVTYRGQPIGTVDAIQLKPDGVQVFVLLNARAKIPVNTEVRVANLSPAGEQYLDFRPRSEHGPYLTDGAVINRSDTSTPVPFTQLVSGITTLVGEQDPKKLGLVVNELYTAFNGTAGDLQRLIDGGDALLTSLRTSLPETISLLDHSRVALGTLADLRPQLSQLSTSGRDLSRRLRADDPVLRELLDKSPGVIHKVDHVVREDSPEITTLFDDFTPVLANMGDHLPAWYTLFPALGGVRSAAETVTHDGRVWTIIDLYGHPLCDYKRPHPDPTKATPIQVSKWVYCNESGPRLQQRGAQNAPRPRGDHTDRPPPGVPEGPKEKTNPLPPFKNPLPPKK